MCLNVFASLNTESQPLALACTTTEGKRCEFPFKYKGKMYSKCITTWRHKLWCGTKTKDDGTYTEWGYCADPLTCKGECLGLPPTGVNILLTWSVVTFDQNWVYSPLLNAVCLLDLTLTYTSLTTNRMCWKISIVLGTLCIFYLYFWFLPKHVK